MSAKKEIKEATEVKLTIFSPDGKKKGEITVDSNWILLKKNTQAVHDAVVMHLANKRRGTSKAKGRSEVNKTKKKPWKQKGTGNARAGKASSPLWRGGGVVFGPHPRDYSYQIPKKVKRLALYSSIAQKLNDKEVIIVEQFQLKEPKTKYAAQFLEKIQAGKSALLVNAAENKDLNLAFRNIPKVETTTLSRLNTLTVLQYKNLVVTQDVFEQLSQKFKVENTK